MWVLLYYSIIMVAGPDIYGVNSADNLKEVQKRAKEGLNNLSSKEMLEELEAKVKLNSDIEKKKNTLRTINYALDPNRKGSVDMWDGKWSHLVVSKDLYEKLATILKDKPWYMPPVDKEAKIFYDISFRLKQLWIDKNSKGEKLNFTNEYNNDFAIAVMAFQKMSWAKKIESIVGPETLWKLLQDDKFTQTVIESNPPADYSLQQRTSSSDNNIGSPIVWVGNPLIDVSMNQPMVSSQYKITLTDGSKVDNIKNFDVAVGLSNTLDNVTKQELKIFEILNKKVNKNDVLYSEFENAIVANIEKKYADGKVKTFEWNIQNNVSDLLRNFSEWYLDENTGEQKEIELDPNFFFAIRDAIITFLTDVKKTKEQKQRLDLFVRSFTANFNDILQSYRV